MKDEALRLALEFFETMQRYKGVRSKIFIRFEPTATGDYLNLQEFDERAKPVITAIKAALEAKDEAWECVCGANLYIDANGIPRSKASVEPATVVFKPQQEAKDEPVAWWIPKAEQFCLQAPSGERPFAKAWEPLYAASPKQEAKDDSVARYCCHSCFKASGGVMLDRLILCSECGNKRCPKATDHNFSCTGSNEPNQWGSIYTTPPQRKPLTDEEIGEVAIKSQDGISPHDDTLRFARAIEAKLKEKNT